MGGALGLREVSRGLREVSRGLREVAQGLLKVTRGPREAWKITCVLTAMNWSLWKFIGGSSRLF